MKKGEGPLSISEIYDPPKQRGLYLTPCEECGAPMLLMQAKFPESWPSLIQKTYQCIMCGNIEQKTVTLKCA
jgi:hypothetical protein